MLALVTSSLSFQAGVTLKAPASSRAAVPVMETATGLKQVRRTSGTQSLLRV